MTNKRILISAGGTGGHVYPAVALAKKLKFDNPNLYIFFAGGGLSKNQFFDPELFPYKDIFSGCFPLKNPLKCLTSFGKIIAGLFQSALLLKKIEPHLIVGFGSYHTLPLLLAARIRGIPYVLHEANSIPGKVNRLMSKNALAIGIVFPEARSYLKGNIVDVDLPLRESMIQSKSFRLKAITYYDLDPDKTTLLFFGGSQGAIAINDSAIAAIKFLKNWKKKIQIIHFSGKKEETKKLKASYTEFGLKAYVKEYEENMEYAWMAADLLVSRSGAGTIAEGIAYEKPGILIPYPYATDKHQDKNAFFMSEVVKGTITLTEKDLTGERLGHEIIKLLENNQAYLNELRENIKKFKESNTRKDFCEFIKLVLI